MHVGKFALWFTYDEDRRGEQADARRLASAQDEGTTVLRTTELHEMIESLREAESAAPVSAAGTAAASGAASPVGMASARVVAPSAWTRHTVSLVVLAVLLAFLGGYIAGGGLSWVPWQRAFGPSHGAVSLLPH